MRRVLVLAFVLLVPDAQAAELRPCGKPGFRCGQVRVPLDYDDPSAGRISVAVTRLRARQPRRRLGTIFLNYGGPGAAAVSPTRRGAYRQFRAFRDRFDLVAFDPRGTGASRPVLSCRVNQERLGIYRHPFRTPSTYVRDRDIALAARYAQRCAARNARLAPHVSTANVARDMDAIRAELGVPRVTYLGFSYGTLLGATYAVLFPDRVRGMVLDGPVDPVGYLNDPLADLARQSGGFEDALRRYFAACRGERRYCRWTRGRLPAAAYEALSRRAASRGFPVRFPRLTRGDRRPVDRDVMQVAVSSDLYAKALWPELTAALNRARRGDGTLLRLIANDDYGRRRDGSYSSAYDRYFMIGASEQAFPREVEPYEAAGADAFTAFPHFFFNVGYSGLVYQQYRVRDEDSFRGPFTLPDAGPEPLVVATTHDPATPYENARGMVAALGRASLLTMRGDGHTAYRSGSRCVDRAVERYVARLRLPRAGLTCRQRLPFPPGRTSGSRSGRAGHYRGRVVASPARRTDPAAPARYAARDRARGRRPGA